MTATTERARPRPRIQFTPLQIVTHIGALIPLAVLLWDAANHRLTANPIQEATYRPGLTTLVLLVLSLAVTPVNTIFGFKQVVRLRRPLGLYGFLYVAIHLFIFAVLDYGLDIEMIRDTIIEKRYVLVGFTAFLLLLPLAITSTKGWMKRLGKRWKKLHYLMYIAVPLGVVHFVWLVKADIRLPLQYAFVVAMLLAVRIPPVRRFFSELRNKLVSLMNQQSKTKSALTKLTKETPVR